MSKNKTTPQKKCTYIGGQAVMEGVMMMGKTCMATAVRDGDGQIQVEAKRLTTPSWVQKALKIPVLRGCINMVLSLVRGMGAMTRSTAVIGDDEEGEPSRFEKWLANTFKVSLMDVVSFVSIIIGVALAVGLFMVLPNLAVSGIKMLFPVLDGTAWEFVLLGVFKLAIFLAYLGLILLIKDIRRLYQYHGAEHKTITCYEYEQPLTPQNAMACTRMHDRCGTSFMFIVLIINIVILSLVNFLLGVQNIQNNGLQLLARLGVEVVLLPVITGVSYEFLKLFAKFDNWFTRIFKAPGLAIQRLFTTREPEEDMLEVAIAAFNKVLEMDADPTVPETSFVMGGVLSQMVEETKKRFAAAEIDESDAEWIYSLTLNVKRSELSGSRLVSMTEAKKIEALVLQRLQGRPLWYIIGDTEFYDCTIKVDERVLIPRPETEILAEAVVKTVEEGNKVLDMCTGSGAIAIAVAKHCKQLGVSVTGADLSDGALMLAKQNAEFNGVSVNFVQSDMFTNVRGRYHVIVCNPPYIRTGEIPYIQKEVREHEPRVALDGGDDGLDFYRILAENISRYIVKGGYLLLECGENQTAEIIKLFKKCEYVIPFKDYSGCERFLKIAF